MEDMPQQAWACASAWARANGALDSPIPQALTSAMDPGASFALATKEDPYASTAQGPACMTDPSQDQLGFWTQSERASEQGRQGQCDGEQCMCACERGVSEDSGQEKGLGTETVPCTMTLLIAKTEITFRIARTEMHDEMYGQHVEPQT